MESRQLADAIRGGNATHLQSLIDELARLDATTITAILRDLMRDSDWGVRGWVPWAAPRMLGSAAEPLLRFLVDDSHADVRTEAIDAILDLDERHINEFVPTLIASAKGEDWQTALWAILRLTRYRVPEAIGLFRELAGTADFPGVRSHAKIFLLVLEGRESDLLAGLKTDDHSLMPIWTKGAVYLGTQAALDALADVTRTDSHAECRGYAENALQHRFETAPKGRH